LRMTFRSVNFSVFFFERVLPGKSVVRSSLRPFSRSGHLFYRSVGSPMQKAPWFRRPVIQFISRTIPLLFFIRRVESAPPLSGFPFPPVEKAGSRDLVVRITFRPSPRFSAINVLFSLFRRIGSFTSSCPFPFGNFAFEVDPFCTDPNSIDGLHSAARGLMHVLSPRVNQPTGLHKYTVQFSFKEGSGLFRVRIVPSMC